jgi:hypothetical protein
LENPLAAAPATGEETVKKVETDLPAFQTGEGGGVAVSPETAFNNYDQRTQTRDYEGAVDALLQLQYSQAQLSGQNRMDYNNRMRAIQKQIASAMASGDPNAMRAAELLKRQAAAMQARQRR